MAATTSRPGSVVKSRTMAVMNDGTEVMRPPAARIWLSAALSVRSEKPPQHDLLLE